MHTTKMNKYFPKTVLDRGLLQTLSLLGGIISLESEFC